MIESVAGMIIAPPMPMSGAEGDQLVGGVRRAATARLAPPKSDETGLERALAPEAVAERAQREQQAGEDEQVGVDDPLQRRRGGVEVLLQRRQRDVEDRCCRAR